jgi:hypothetical protein
VNIRISALRRLQPFTWGFALLSCLLFCFAALPVHAQSNGASAGGNWTQYEYEDKMTAARNVRFELIANAGQHDLYSQARVELLCENGRWRGANFTPGSRLGPPTHPGFWGQPKMEVMVRVDSRHHNHGWNWNGRFLAMDKGTTRELIGARIFNVEFLGPSGPQIAEFSPSGIDLTRVFKACGLAPKKP